MRNWRRSRYRHHVMVGFFALIAGTMAPYSEPTLGRGFKDISRVPVMTQGPISPQEALVRPVIVDPGHGGNDQGARVKGVNEKDISFSISRKLQDIVMKHGAVPAILTRDSDNFIPLDERVVKSIQWHGQAVVSIHVDEIRSKKMHGMTVYSYGRSFRKARPRRTHLEPLPPPPRNVAREGADLARAVSRSLRAAGFYVEGPEKEDFYVLKNPKVPSVLIEVGYLSNPQDAKKLVDPVYQDRIAKAISLGLDAYMAGIKKHPSASSIARRPK